MARLYKLTDAQGMTKNNTQWNEGATHTVTEPGAKLCSNQVIHAYTTPLLAVMMNPAHADIRNPILWLAKGTIVTNDGTKVGCKSLTTIRRIDLPQITTEQRIRFAIFCAMRVYEDKSFIRWARSWLGADAAADAADAADAARAAAHAADAADAARAAADAAATRAGHAHAARAARAAHAAAHAAAYAAAYSARAAVHAAARAAVHAAARAHAAAATHAAYAAVHAAAAHASPTLNLATLARKAVRS